MNTIDCHKADIQQIAITCKGDTIATCSQTGTVIRLFDIKTQVKILEFRRGINPALVDYLQFSVDGLYLSCCSNKDTIHLFKVNEVNTTSYFGMLSYLVPITGD